MTTLSIEQKLKKALIQSLTGRYIVYAVQLLSMMVMARLFTPEQFGIFAAIQVFSTFFMLFSEMGIAPALINQNKITPSMRDGIFSLTSIIGTIIAGLFYFSGELISQFYNNPIYNTLSLPIALSVIFTTISIVPTASLQKSKRFFSIAKCDSIAELLSLLFTLAIYRYINPIYLLAIKPLFISSLKLVLLWFASANTETGKAHFGKDITQIRPLLSFSLYQFGFNIVNYFSRNLDNILVAKFFSADSLGIYDRAYKVMRYPLMLLTFALNPAIQPVLKEVQNNPLEFERLHNKFVRKMSFIGLVMGAAIYLLSEIIVLILLGKQWLSVAPILQILALTIPIQIVLSSSGGFFQAAGRADLLFKCGVFSSIINVSFISLGIYLGSLELLSWCLCCSFFINYIQAYYLMAKHLLPGGLLGYINSIRFSLIGKLTLLLIGVWRQTGSL